MHTLVCIVLWVLCLGASTGMSIDYVALARLDRRVGLVGLVYKRYNCIFCI